MDTLYSTVATIYLIVGIEDEIGNYSILSGTGIRQSVADALG